MGRLRVSARAAETNVPRRVLLVYDGAEESFLPYTTAHRLLALPLEHLGLVPEYLDARGPLPDQSLAGRYAGVITWLTDDETERPERYRAFLIRQIETKVPLVILGRLGVPLDPLLSARLGVQGSQQRARFTLSRHDGVAGFEAAPPRAGWADALVYGPGHRRHIEVTDAAGKVASPVTVAPWGSMALDPFVVQEGYRKRSRWIVDPFALIGHGLSLPMAPVLDATTENGRRLLIAHIDGDGFASRAELPRTPFSAEVIAREILETFPIPTTVSIIEGETGAKGLYGDLSPQLEDLARRIFRLPNVEIASHTYSHPFDWLRAAGRPLERNPYDEEPDEDPDHLPIAGYQYDTRREVEGSVRYIDARLAPPEKKTRVFLWSGSALPGEEAVALAEELGLRHMNGDNAEEPGDLPVLAQVPSLGRPLGSKRFQVYAPTQNEMVYTNLWQGPFYGYRRVVEMFRYTDRPRRLKPIGIYYHFYSGTKPASLAALKEVYQWALAEEVRPIWASDYTRKVEQFQSATISSRPDGSFRIEGVGHIRTVRLPAGLGWPDFERSRGVVGVRDLPQGRYVALDGSPMAILYLRAEEPKGPYLVSSNAEIVHWRRERTARGTYRVSFRLRGEQNPLVANLAGCSRDAWTFAGRDTGEVAIECP